MGKACSKCVTEPKKSAEVEIVEVYRRPRRQLRHHHLLPVVSEEMGGSTSDELGEATSRSSALKTFAAVESEDASSSGLLVPPELRSGRSSLDFTKMRQRERLEEQEEVEIKAEVLETNTSETKQDEDPSVSKSEEIVNDKKPQAADLFVRTILGNYLQSKQNLLGTIPEDSSKEKKSEQLLNQTSSSSGTPDEVVDPTKASRTRLIVSEKSSECIVFQSSSNTESARSSSSTESLKQKSRPEEKQNHTKQDPNFSFRNLQLTGSKKQLELILIESTNSCSTGSNESLWYKINCIEEQSPLEDTVGTQIDEGKDKRKSVERKSISEASLDAEESVPSMKWKLIITPHNKHP